MRINEPPDENIVNYSNTILDKCSQICNGYIVHDSTYRKLRNKQSYLIC
jgi:hypothetical protein